MSKISLCGMAEARDYWGQRALPSWKPLDTGWKPCPPRKASRVLLAQLCSRPSIWVLQGVSSCKSNHCIQKFVVFFKVLNRSVHEKPTQEIQEVCGNLAQRVIHNFSWLTFGPDAMMGKEFIIPCSRST